MQQNRLAAWLGTDASDVPRGLWLGNAVWMAGLAGVTAAEGSNWPWIGVMAVGVAVVTVAIVAAERA